MRIRAQLATTFTLCFGNLCFVHLQMRPTRKHITILRKTRPAEQDVHSAAPALAYVPRSHTAHGNEPSEKVPAEHTPQTVDFSPAAYRPGAQAVHSVDGSSSSSAWPAAQLMQSVPSPLGEYVPR